MGYFDGAADGMLVGLLEVGRVEGCPVGWNVGCLDG